MGVDVQFYKDVYSGKLLHRVYMQCLEQSSNFPDLFAWRKSACLKNETGGILFSALGQTLPTWNFQKMIFNVNIVDRSRVCHAFNETVQHLMNVLLLSRQHIWRDSNDMIFVLTYLLCPWSSHVTTLNMSILQSSMETDAIEFTVTFDSGEVQHICGPRFLNDTPVSQTWRHEVANTPIIIGALWLVSSDILSQSWVCSNSPLGAQHFCHCGWCRRLQC